MEQCIGAIPSFELMSVQHVGVDMYGDQKLTPGLVDELRKRVNPETGRPYTLTEIGNMFGVSRQYVFKLKKRGTYRSPREVIMESWPWDNIPPEQQNATYHILRDHLEYVATQGKHMQDWKLSQLRDFYERLDRRGWVVEYSPDIGPNEHAENGGFTYRERKLSDAGLIIRQNRVTKLTDKDRVVWRFPPKRPKVN